MLTSVASGTLLASLAGSVVFLPVFATHFSRQHSLAVQPSASCANLANKGSHFTVEVSVGTAIEGQASQNFSLVADTGSNQIIVESCQCQATGACERGEHCFIGTDHSSSFSVERTNEGLPSVGLSFGSGTINAIVASDVVRVGEISAMAENALLLMYTHRLNFKGQFEGILGLGIPQKTSFAASRTSAAESNRSKISNNKIIQQIINELGKVITRASGRHVDSVGLHTVPPTHKVSRNDTSVEPASFLELANISRFSMCFNEKTDGVLRLGTPVLKTPLSSVGVLHWGLDFRGIRIGNSTEPVVCSIDDMPPTQDTPCGIIPDSGTTQILGPPKQVNSVLDAICDGWDRCRSNFTAFEKAREAAARAAAAVYGYDPFRIRDSSASKRDVLVELLSDCESWLTEGEGLRELPSVNFVVAGKGTEKAQTVELTGWSYVMQMSLTESKRSKMEEVEGRPIPRLICMHAFGPIEYNTPKNGPAWILGTPLFYTYRVDYETSPPSMSFTNLNDEPCGSCGKTASFVSDTRGTHASFKQYPRKVWGEMRSPAIDVSQPF
eukprot:TRINITY_DN3325_c0_g2_i1.p1 TRINITY_DN3325_c0_g2~~TRINITY_DN3325_c0_g2_i1.p1  ORF type:complete len:554 (+),score=76.87 TRINITY_DN3325_c0_g2_i1:83-1744(+)